MEEQSIPPVTDIGARLAEDEDGTHLQELLDRLGEEKSSMLSTPLGKEALESAREILRTVWSMQHMDKLSQPNNPLPPRP